MPTHITTVGAVFVPVTDQERSLAFFTGVLGFELVADFPYGGRHRWLEVRPRGATNTLALVPPTEGRSAGGDVTRCALGTPDIEADRAALVAAGVDVDPIAGAGGRRPGLVSEAEAVEDPVPPQCLFRDPDGNRFLLVQPA